MEKRQISKKNVITEFRNYSLPEHFPVLLLTGENWKISDVPSGRLHFHDCLEIGVCHSENGTIEFYEESCGFCKGDVTCIPAHVPHTTYSAPGTKSRWSYLFFQPARLFRNWIPGMADNIDLYPVGQRRYRYILHGEDYPEVYGTAVQIIREMAGKKEGYQLSARGLLLSLYIQLYRIQMQEPAKEDQAGSPVHILFPAISFVEKNYPKEFSMSYLAELCGFSPAHFRRVFLKIMGMTPLEYVNRVRIREACSLLATTEMPILHVSEASGFGSVSSFNRDFKKIIGSTPYAYRKKSADILLKYNGWMTPEEPGTD